MHRRSLFTLLSEFKKSPFFTLEEEAVLERFVDFIKGEPLCFDRRPNPCHVTGSALVVRHDFSRVLLMHHRKIDKWLQFGGHADGDADVKAVAMREAFEESGIDGLSYVVETPIDIDIHDLPPNVACKTHFDLRFLLKAPQHAQFIVNEESKGIAWYTYDAAKAIVNDEPTRRLIRKAEQFYLDMRSER